MGHTYVVAIVKDLGKVVATCPTCDRCVEVRVTGGGVRIVRRGDPTARHGGWAVPAGIDADGEAEIVADNRPEDRNVH